MLYIDDQHIYIINIWIGLMQDYAKNEKIGNLSLGILLRIITQ
jgi:hypothetical protein